MFDFIRKKDVWDACDKGYLDELKSKNISYQLKNAQDLAIYRLIRDLQGLEIAEIGGGNSRILECVTKNNRCTNIEKFEGRDLGPVGEIKLKDITNIDAYIGDFDPRISDCSFDLIFSISVVEHVETERLADFYRDSLRILKPGGKFLHAIDIYIQDTPTNYNIERYKIYRNWVTANHMVAPIGKIYNGHLDFMPDMASNPDNILYGWNKMVPLLSEVRAISQNVSLIVGAKKIESNDWNPIHE